MTAPGIYRHRDGGLYRVLGTARDATNGAGEGRSMVVYVSLSTGKLHVREETQFNEELVVTSYPDTDGDEVRHTVRRFTFIEP